MVVEWNAYDASEVAPSPYEELPRVEAHAAYERLMDAKERRIAMLRDLLALNGITLGTSEKDLRELDRWFRANVEPDPEDSRRPSRKWLSVSTDLGLFIGEAIIERKPDVRWHFFEGRKRHISNYRPTLVGFDVPNPEYAVDPLALVYDYAFRIVQGGGRSERDNLVEIVRG